MQPVACGIPNFSRLEPGSYLLAVEHDGSQGSLSYQFSIAFRSNGECLTPDGDRDGETICAGDCNDADPAINRHGDEGESCDQVDDDCDGKVDDLTTTCTVNGELGVCAEGRLFCLPGGGTSCESTSQGDPQGRDYCDDGLDNDCDGGVDEQGCVTLPAGDVCSDAVDVGGGGIFNDSLSGYGNDQDVGCGDGGFGNVERFYRITLSETRRLHIDLKGTIDNSLSVVMAASCADVGPQASCTGGFFDEVLPAGSYVFAVHAKLATPYELRVYSELPDDFEHTSCIPADADADGYTLCTNDCDPNNDGVNPGAFEVCDGFDNDCNGQVDTLAEGCFFEGEPGVGVCAGGHYGCTSSTNEPPECLQNTPSPEVCNALDDDCDGLIDDGISCGGGSTCATNTDSQSCMMQGCAWDAIKNVCNPKDGGGVPACSGDGLSCASSTECCSGFCDGSSGKCGPAPGSQCGIQTTASSCQAAGGCTWDNVGMKCFPSAPPACLCDTTAACEPGCGCDPNCGPPPPPPQCKPDGLLCEVGAECCSTACIGGKCMKP